MNFNTRTFKSSHRINQVRFAKQSWVLYFYNLLTDINDANYEQKQSFIVVFIFIYIGIMLLPLNPVLVLKLPR